MKKIFLPIVVLAAALTTGCNENLLNIPQKGVDTMQSFYKTDQDAEEAMVAAYQGFLWNICTKEGGNIYAPMRAVFNLCGDDMYAAGEFYGDNDFMAAMNEFRYDSSSDVIRNAYSNIYYAMYYSNIVIEKFTRDDATPVMKRVVAEAKVLRAYMHMMLAIGWGNPPVIDHLIDAAELPYNCDTDPSNPMSHNELLLWCAKECEDVIDNLDERDSTTDKDGAVKVTKGFAWAVAGKARLFAGDYAGAKTDLKKVIESGKYDLVPGERYAENFHIEGDCNEEKIFEANLEDNTSLDFWDVVNRSTWMEANIWNWRSDHFVANPSTSYSSIDGWGGCGVPQSFVDEFIENDGLDSYRLNATIISIEDVVYNSVYNLADVDAMTPEQKATSDKVGLDARGLYGQSFYLPLKPVARIADLKGRGQNIRLNNYVLMRYAEVLLMYAEACVQTGDAASALPVIQKIQRRAGSRTISTSVDMDVIKKEKKLELWLEGCRWPDLVRWGDTEGVEKAGQDVTVLYDKFTREPKSTDRNVKWFDSDSRFYTVSTHAALDQGATVGFKAGKHEYFPFPFSVTSKNPNLTQRDIWK